MERDPTFPRRSRNSSTEPLPSLTIQLDRVLDELAERQQLGLLYVTVLHRTGKAERAGGWQAYDAMLEATFSFLRDFHRRRLRDSDTLLEPLASGNAFVLLLDAPREPRPIDAAAVSGVCSRLQRQLKTHLARHLSKEAREAFGCYVGGTVMRHEPEVEPERIVYRGLEEAFVNALRAQEREGIRHAQQLRHILHSARVRAVYQPVVEIQDERVLGFEALTRVPPIRFETPDLMFRVASDNDALWTLERLCRQKALEGLPALDSKQVLFLNTEPDSIHDPELSGATFLEQIRHAGLSPEQVVLEFTEHAAVTDFAAFRRELASFRANGFRVAIDDVGSGFSGLRAIAEIEPEFIKAELTLVRDLHTNAIKRDLLTTLVRFAERIGSTLIAEGVETVAELQALSEIGVRCAQGLLFAGPDAAPRTPNWAVLRHRQ